MAANMKRRPVNTNGSIEFRPILVIGKLMPQMNVTSNARARCFFSMLSPMEDFLVGVRSERLRKTRLRRSYAA
jgi:hypothetical protein